MRPTSYLLWIFPLLVAAQSLFSAPKPLYTQNARPEWQWSIAVPNVISGETQKNPRAFLWIPPGCQRLRGVVVGQHNMEEEQIFEHPTFRRALTELNFAVVWVTPAFDLFFQFDKGAGQSFDGMMAALAEDSGYDELTRVPVVPLGHSAAASYPWHFGFWAPDRILAAMSISGQWPYYKDKNSADWGDRTLDGVPGLVTMGEYEDAYHRAGTGLRDRADHPRLPLSMLAEPAGEHFSATDLKISFLGLYLRKAAQHRLPDDWPVDEAPKLRPIDPTTQGWLVDRGRLDGKSTAPAAPVGSYTGDPKEAFWVFDGELARAVETFGTYYAGKKQQFIAYTQGGVVVPQRKSHVRVGLKTDIQGDDLSFSLGGAFLDAAPADWRGFKAGDPVTHAEDASAFTIARICGPVEQIGPDRFALRFSRAGMDNPKRSNSLCFILSHPGDDVHKPMSLEAEMKFPLTNKEGAPQEISFDTPASIKAGTLSLPLAARSSAGLPVFFYVREGPAVIEGNTLRLTAIPPRAKFPVKVTVVAWQWGRATPPKVQTATPVERTLLLTR